MLAGISILDILIIQFMLPNKYVPDRSETITFKSIFKSYLEVLKVRQFLIYTIAGALSFSGLFVYITASATIYIDGFGLSKQMFGLVFALLAGGMIAGGQINNLLMKKYESSVIFKSVLLFQVCIAFVFSIGVMNNFFGIALTTISLFLLLTSSGIGFPNAAALALAPFSKNVGSASSMMGFLQMSLGAACAAAAALFHVQGALPTAVVMFTACTLASGIIFRYQKILPSEDNN